MNLMRILQIGLLLVALVFLGLFMLFERYEPVSADILSDRLQIQNARPIGEITAEFTAEQLIAINPIKQRRQIPDNNNTCIELLLANWSDRANSGEFAVDLIIAGETFTRVIEAASIKDNTNHRICFENLQASKLADNGEIRLTLRGISSPAGAAITAWTTTDLSAGELINSPEQLVSRSLVFHFVSERYSARFYPHAWIMVLLGMLAITSMFFPASVGRKQGPLSSKGDEK